jgi:hypothetical protein|uniref:Uncharacterized protein n=1 Tax=Podoviridae sp. ctDwO1 TaxID=2827726 RepID=A0A8S5TA50_9CAUD|nr:MAG TPA: hypothetical protein [Podoviridae sp. ctDwO1]
MKVEIQCGDSITIPKGCKAIIKDGSITFVKEDREFKDGDVLIDDRKLSVFPCKIIMIYKGTKSEEGGYECYIFRNLMGSLVINGECCGSEFVRIRHASEEEKAELFAEMKEQGLRWNAEEKRVEKIRWRAECGEKYFVLSMDGRIYSYEEYNNTCDDVHYNAFNYFRTEEQDKEAARRVKETLRKFHEEIGE